MRVLVVAGHGDISAIEALRHMLPEGVTLMVQETVPSTPMPDPVLAMSLVRHETPSLLRLKQENPRAWYRKFERKRK